MAKRSGRDRRTGLALLVFGAASNFLPWMELITGQTTTAEPVTARDWGIALSMCALAAVVLCAAWLAGRRRPARGDTRIKNPRRTGLQATLATCSVNAILTAAILFLRTREVGGPLGEFGVLAFLWLLVSLPVQILAAFALGRTSVHSPGRRGVSRPAPVEA
jgi:hypothetical protein